MLGIKSNREPIRGAFAKKVRKELSCIRKGSTSCQGLTQTDTSEK